jgi:hypothetical protein
VLLPDSFVDKVALRDPKIWVQCLKELEKQGLLRLEYGGVTIVDLERLRSYDD